MIRTTLNPTHIARNARRGLVATNLALTPRAHIHRRSSIFTTLLALAIASGLLTIPCTSSGGRALAASSSTHNDTSSGTIIPVQPGSGATTTPNACNGALSECTTAMLKIINQDRASYGLPKLNLKPAQSVGKASCVGSYGHSQAMARSGAIWHANAQFPRASFPNNICVHFMHAEENVGESSSGSALSDLKSLDTMMMGEPHSKNVCASTVNHACNILNPAFHQLGIGVYYSNGATWLTEDFTN
jgi:uncharacterized protein YkwD